MSDDTAKHVYFLQKKKAEILARKNREKGGFEPSALLKIANDGSFLERFNKMMQQKKEQKEKGNQKQSRKQSTSMSLSSTSYSLDYIDEFQLYGDVKLEIDDTTVEYHDGDFPNDVSHESRRRKRKEESSTSYIKTENNDISNKSGPSKIQRFSAGELAQLIQIKKSDDSCHNSKDKDMSKDCTEKSKVNSKREKRSDRHSCSTSKSQNKKEKVCGPKNLSNRDSPKSNVEITKEKSKGDPIHSNHSKKDSHANSKDSLNGEVREKEKIEEVSNKQVNIRTEERDRRKSEKEKCSKEQEKKKVKDKKDNNISLDDHGRNTSPVVTRDTPTVVEKSKNMPELPPSGEETSSNSSKYSKATEVDKEDIKIKFVPVSYNEMKPDRKETIHNNLFSGINDEPLYNLAKTSDCCELALLELIPQHYFPGKKGENGKPLPLLEYACENDVTYSDYSRTYRAIRLMNRRNLANSQENEM